MASRLEQNHDAVSLENMITTQPTSQISQAKIPLTYTSLIFNLLNAEGDVKNTG
jgi:hypothetical protein